MPHKRGNPGPHTNLDSLNPTAIETLVSQRVVAAMVNFKANRNTGSGAGSGQESTQGDNRGPPKAYSYKDFMNCKPKSFHRNEGVVSLTCWIEKMESVFEISFCVEECKVKFATYTIENAALTM